MAGLSADAFDDDARAACVGQTRGRYGGGGRTSSVASIATLSAASRIGLQRERPWADVRRRGSGAVILRAIFMVILLTELALLAIGTEIACRVWGDAGPLERATVASVIVSALWLGSTWVLALSHQLTMT